MTGRPRRTAEVTPLFLRIPQALLARVDRCQALLQLQAGVRHTRTMTIEVLLGIGCAATEAGVDQQTLLGQHGPVSRIAETAYIVKIEEIAEIAQVSSIAEIPRAIEIEPEPAWDTPAQAPAPAGVPAAREAADRGDMRRRIVALLQEHPAGLSPAQIRVHLGVEKRLAHTLIAMMRDGLVRRLGAGRYVVDEMPDT